MKTNLFTPFGLAFTVALMTMTSCSQNENEPAVPMEEKQALNISVASTNFNNVDPEARALTDAAHAVTFEEGDKMGLFAVSEDKVILNNVPLTYNAEGKWATEGGRRIYYYEGADYIAYYPYAKVNTPTAAEEEKTLTETVEAAIKATNTIPNDQSTADAFEAADLMMAKKIATEVAANKTLNFSLAHQNAMIEFVLPAHKMKYPKAGKTTASTEATDFVEFSVPMTGFELTSLGTTATTEALKPYAIGDSRTFRMIVAANTVPQFAGKFYDPNGNMPVNIANTDATTALTAGTYHQYKVTQVKVDNDVVSYSETATAIDIIGSYLCADGSILPYSWVVNGADASNAVGIVFGQVGENDFANTDKANSGYNYYAIATKAYNNSGFDKETDGTFKLDGVFQVTTDDDNTNFYSKEDMSGYASTQALLSINAGNTIKGILNTKFTAPAGNNSGWFIASAGQWWMLAKAANGQDVTPTYNGGWQQGNGTVYNWMIDRLGRAGISTNNIGATNWTLTRCTDTKIVNNTSPCIHSAAWATNKFLIGCVPIVESNSNRFVRPIIAF